MPRPDVSAVRKEQILDAAAKAFTQMGFDAARMDDIAEMAGFSKGVLYHYFSSKQEIILALMERIFSPDLDILREMDSHKGHILDYLLEYFESMTTMMDQLIALYPVLLEFYAAAMRSEPKIQDFMRRYITEYCNVIGDLLQQGIERGEVKSLDPYETALTIIGLGEGTALMMLLQNRPSEISAAVRKSLRQFFDFLRA